RRFGLPQEIFVRLVEPDSPLRGEREEVGLVHCVERRMSFQEIGNTIANGRSFHGSSAESLSSFRPFSWRMTRMHGLLWRPAAFRNDLVAALSVCVLAGLCCAIGHAGQLQSPA